MSSHRIVWPRVDKMPLEIQTVRVATALFMPKGGKVICFSRIDRCIKVIEYSSTSFQATTSMIKLQ